MRNRTLPRGPRAALWAVLCTATLAVPASACINHYERPAPAPKPRPERPAEFIAKLRTNDEHNRLVAMPPPRDPGPGAHFKVRSDYAATLVHRGESHRAVQILESVEKSNPGEYQVAANLGTAYELSGDLARAHYWIREGIRRNPNSHDASEWIHLRILEARQALEKDPDWLRSNSVLDLDFGADAQPRFPARWPKEAGSADATIAALTYQLHERLAFVPAPDALVGALLADLAALLMLYRTVDVALPVFDLALSYRPADATRVKTRREAADAILRSRGKLDPLAKTLLIGFAGLAFAGALFLKLRR